MMRSFLFGLVWSVLFMALAFSGCRQSATEKPSGITAEEAAALIEIEREIQRLQAEKLAAERKFIP